MRAQLSVVGESCPVCGSEAQRGQDTRDVVKIRCPRCGPFTVSGTAVAMLTSRLKEDDRSRARASHAIRSATSNEHSLEIDSTNVDKLVGSALPRAGQQIDNFLNWMSVELGDDQMGLVQLPQNLDHLAGVIGAVDGERIEALASAMQNEGLIERLSDNRVRLTMAACNRIEQRQNAAQRIETPLVVTGRRGSEEEAAFPLEAGDIIRAHCRNCGPHRKALVLARYVGSDDEDEDDPDYQKYEHGDVTIDDYRILRCRGCETVSVQKVSVTVDHWTEWGEEPFNPKTGEYHPNLDPTITYWPAPSNENHHYGWSTYRIRFFVDFWKKSTRRLMQTSDQ